MEYESENDLCALMEYVVTEAPNNDKAIQSRHKQPDIPQDCVASQAAIWGLHCLFLLTSSKGDLHELRYVCKASTKMDIK